MLNEPVTKESVSKQYEQMSEANKARAALMWKQFVYLLRSLEVRKALFALRLYENHDGAARAFAGVAAELRKMDGQLILNA